MFDAELHGSLGYFLIFYRPCSLLKVVGIEKKMWWSFTAHNDSDYIKYVHDIPYMHIKNESVHSVQIFLAPCVMGELKKCQNLT